MADLKLVGAKRVACENALLGLMLNGFNSISFSAHNEHSQQTVDAFNTLCWLEEYVSLTREYVHPVYSESPLYSDLRAEQRLFSIVC